jgi:hypothetical protein
MASGNLEYSRSIGATDREQIGGRSRNRQAAKNTDLTGKRDCGRIIEHGRIERYRVGSAASVTEIGCRVVVCGNNSFSQGDEAVAGVSAVGRAVYEQDGEHVSRF